MCGIQFRCVSILHPSRDVKYVHGGGRVTFGDEGLRIIHMYVVNKTRKIMRLFMKRQDEKR